MAEDARCRVVGHQPRSPGGNDQRRVAVRDVLVHPRALADHDRAAHGHRVEEHGLDRADRAKWIAVGVHRDDDCAGPRLQIAGLGRRGTLARLAVRTVPGLSCLARLLVFETPTSAERTRKRFGGEPLGQEWRTVVVPDGSADARCPPCPTRALPWPRRVRRPGRSRTGRQCACSSSSRPVRNRPSCATADLSHSPVPRERDTIVTFPRPPSDSSGL